MLTPNQERIGMNSPVGVLIIVTGASGRNLP